MKCKKCGGKLNVVTTRRKGDKKMPSRYDFIDGCFTVRSLRCIDCGNKSTTIELEEEEAMILQRINRAKMAINNIFN